MDKQHHALNLAMARVDHGKAVTDVNLAATPPKELPPQPSSSSTNGGGHDNNALGAPPYRKLDFPSYAGKEDPLPWLKRCEQYFWGQKTREEEKMWLVRNHLTGTARQWYCQLERDEGVPTWPRFSDYVTSQVLPTPQHVLRARLNRGTYEAGGSLVDSFWGKTYSRRGSTRESRG